MWDRESSEGRGILPSPRESWRQNGQTALALSGCLLSGGRSLSLLASPSRGVTSKMTLFVYSLG